MTRGAILFFGVTFLVVGGPAPSRAAARLDPSQLRPIFEQALDEFDEAQNLLSRQPDRALSLFRSAALRFEGLRAAGLVNGRLEFNLGNCYLQAGDIGRAILHYLRAQRLIPRDPMLGENLAVARSRCLTHIVPTRRSAVLSGVFFWHFETSVRGRLLGALVLYITFWLVLIARNFVRTRVLTMTAIACAILCGGCAASVGVQRWSNRNAPDGVITAMDVTVYKGPGAGYQRQFEQPLQPGVEFNVREKTSGGWWKIELVDGKTGWIESSLGDLVPNLGL